MSIYYFANNEKKMYTFYFKEKDKRIITLK